MNVDNVFQEIKEKLRNNSVYWTGHAKKMHEERFKNSITRRDIINSILVGEVIRFEWQYGYEPRLLVYCRYKVEDKKRNTKHIIFHAAVENAENPVIVTLYNDLYEFMEDGRTRKKNYFSRKN